MSRLRTLSLFALALCPIVAVAQGRLPHDLPLEELPSPPRQVDLRDVLIQLKEERKHLAESWYGAADEVSKGLGASQETQILSSRVRELLSKFQSRQAAQKVLPNEPSVSTPTLLKLPPIHTEKKPRHAEASVTAAQLSDATPVDALAMGQALFQLKEYDKALASLKQVNLQGLKPEERVPIVYLQAVCKAHLGQTEEAIQQLNEIAGSKGDETMALLAQWQISNLRWGADLKERLKRLREKTVTSASVK